MSDTRLQAAHFQELLSRYFDNAHSLCLLPSCSPHALCAAICSQMCVSPRWAVLVLGSSTGVGLWELSVGTA